MTYHNHYLTYICIMNKYVFDHVRLSPSKQIDLHTQPTWELSYVAMGSGIRETGDVHEPFKAGELVLIPPGIPHCWHFDSCDADQKDCIENISIFMEDDFLKEIACVLPALSPVIENLRANADSVWLYSRQAAKPIVEILLRMCGETETERAVSMVELLYLLGREDNRRVVGRYFKPDVIKQRLSQVRIYVSCNYNRPITLDEISGYVGMNRSAFCVFFRKHTGQTFVDYLNAYRIDKACCLLQEGNYSITEVCYSTGFNDLAYFSRAFRRYKGVSPSHLGK